MKKHINIPIFIPHLGCPNGCVFCNQKTISGHGGFSREAVREEIEHALSTVTGDVPVQIAYFGGSFTGIPREDMLFLLQTAKEYIDGGRCDSVRISTRPDYIDGKILEILRAHGVKTVELGIQSMDDRVLLAAKRGHTATDTVRACSLIKAYGFELVGQMMTGLPMSSAEAEVMTARRICEMGADGARIYPTVVFRATELEKMAENGEYTPFFEEDAVERTARVLGVFIERNVPVIRIGLQATEVLVSGEETVGGGYHPAVGELAYSRYFRDALEAALAKREAFGRSAEIAVNPKDLSKMIGQHGQNREYLKTHFSLEKLRFVPSEKMEKHKFTVTLT